jgi:formylglycine-generating enzyme required for sulfatase activity
VPADPGPATQQRRDFSHWERLLLGASVLLLVIGLGGLWWLKSDAGYALMPVAAGTYRIGCTPGQSTCDPEDTAHDVVLSAGFHIGRSEVTQGLWEEVMGFNPSAFVGCGAHCPVEQVSWCDAVAFANALSQREGLTPAYSGLPRCAETDGASVEWDRSSVGYRLPTETEWEVAARGGEDHLFSGASALDAVGWFGDNSQDTPHPVCQKQANVYGLCDMSGNVWEWCWDYTAAYPNGPVTDPTGPAAGTTRIDRGGSWYDFNDGGARISYRGRDTANYHSYYLGFRLARSVI